MKFKSVVVIERGGPDVLQVVENEPRQPMEDVPLQFSMLRDHKIKPIIAKRLPILEARKAELLESENVSGTIVLLAPELL